MEKIFEDMKKKVMFLVICVSLVLLTITVSILIKSFLGKQ